MALIDCGAAEERPSILVVDDLVTNLELLEAIFVQNGFAVFSALDAYTALDIFESEKVDIAIVDVMMPGMDGFELCVRLKKGAESNSSRSFSSLH